LKDEVHGNEPLMGDLRIRRLTLDECEVALRVINTAALWYRDFLPEAEYHEPEMTASEWQAEAERATWYGAFSSGVLVGVMALEYVRDVALLRHGYVLAEHQRKGIGSRLMSHLEGEVRGVGRIVVGTYAGNAKARGALERAGYRLSDDSEAVLRRYYAIPEDRLRSSVTYEKPV
jgi:GNAT superfamily N-acetyltransferase